MKGGARARSGPAPDPNALRRDRDSGDWVTLDADGRQGPAPDWPLGDDIDAFRRQVSRLERDPETTKSFMARLTGARDKLAAAEARLARETELWEQEWKRPQAIQWEKNGQELEVALYVRSVVDAEALGAPTNARTLVKQMQEALGISIPGLQRNHWIIGEAPVAGDAPAPSPRGSSRDRFTVHDGGKA